MTTTALDNIRHLIARFADYGVKVAVVGGSARDTFLGRPPKDFDFVFLTYPATDIPLISIIQTITGTPVADLGGNGNGSNGTSDSCGDAEARGLESVWESYYEGLQCQFLLYTKERTAAFDGDPWFAVMEHDCDLNKAWFEVHGDRLVARVSDDFPQPNGINSFRRDTDPQRVAYMKAKFPDFTHV